MVVHNTISKLQVRHERFLFYALGDSSKGAVTDQSLSLLAI